MLRFKLLLLQMIVTCIINNMYAQHTRNLMAQCDRYYAAGQRDTALALALKAEDAAKTEYKENSKMHAYVAACYVGYCYEATGQKDSAGNWYRYGINIMNRIHDTTSNEYAACIVNYGNYCNSLGKYFDARDLFIKAIPIATKYKDINELGAAENGLANAYVFFGEYTRGQQLYLKWEPYLKMGPKSADEANLYNNIANTYLATGLIDKALEYQKKAVSTYNAIGVNGQMQAIDAEIGLAQIFLAAQMPDRAFKLYDSLQQALYNKQNSLQYALILRGKGLVAIQQKKYNEAEQLLQMALIIIRSLDIKNNASFQVANDMGGLLIREHKYAQAGSVFKTNIAEAAAAGLEHANVMQEMYKGLCESLMLLNRSSEAGDSLLVLSHMVFDALRHNFPGMSEQEQLEYKGGLDVFFDELYSFIYYKNIKSGALINLAFRLELERKNIVLSSKAHLLNTAREFADTTLKATFYLWQQNLIALYKQYSLPAKQRTVNVDSLKIMCDLLEKQIGASDTAFISGIATDYIASNKTGYTEIEFIKFRYIDAADFSGSKACYAAFTLKPGSIAPTFVYLCNSSTIVNLMKRRDGVLIKEDLLAEKLYGKDKSNNSIKLYNLIWAPVEKTLDRTHKNLVISYSPAGILNKINFTAIFDGSQYLGEKYNFHRVIRLTGDRQITTVYNTVNKVHIWSDINYNKAVWGNNHLSASPHSKDIFFDTLSKVSIDLRRLFNHYNYNIFADTGIFATEDSFKVMASSMEGILHVNTHGGYLPYNRQKMPANVPPSFLAANTDALLRNYLAFAGANYYWTTGRRFKGYEDGILTAYEVSMLDLSRVNLVVLAACESGLGDVSDDEGNFGLQRAFKIAGAKNILVSLWQVPAVQTNELLTFFYKNVLAGVPLNEALQKAQEAEKSIHPAPYYWAGFILAE